MLEKPEIEEQLIIDRLHQSYGLQVSSLTFLPLGADVNTAVYRVEAWDGTAYFLKLRRGGFDEITVTVPQFLHAQGINAIIPPLETRQGSYWDPLGDFTLILYPFIEGKNGYEVTLTNQQWIAFGTALKAIHTMQVPYEIAHRIPHENFSTQTRVLVRAFQEKVETTSFDDHIAIKTAAFMQSKRLVINRLVSEAESLAAKLLKNNLDLVLCHSDIHPGNLFLSHAGLYIVDWDNPIFAPKEHDLSLIGGTAMWNNAQQINLFYRGYEKTQIDAVALAYYRFERILLDIAEFSKQLLLSTGGEEDRMQSYHYFTGQFDPGQEVELALR